MSDSDLEDDCDWTYEDLKADLDDETFAELEGAATTIQRLYRFRFANKRVVERVRTIYTAMVDPYSGHRYFYNSQTGQEQWEKVVRVEHLGADGVVLALRGLECGDAVDVGERGVGARGEEELDCAGVPLVCGDMKGRCLVRSVLCVDRVGWQPREEQPHGRSLAC